MGFRETAASKGWSMVNLAWRWKISPEYLSRLANDPRRDPWWNDALVGLPKLSAIAARKLDKERLAAKPSPKRDRKPPDESSKEGYRYHNDLEPGAVVALITELAGYPEGTRGMVKDRAQTGKGEKYHIAIGDYVDWYDPDDIDRLMVATGEVRAKIDL